MKAEEKLERVWVDGPKDGVDAYTLAREAITLLREVIEGPDVDDMLKPTPAYMELPGRIQRFLDGEDTS